MLPFGKETALVGSFYSTSSVKYAQATSNTGGRGMLNLWPIILCSSGIFLNGFGRVINRLPFRLDAALCAMPI